MAKVILPVVHNLFSFNEFAQGDKELEFSFDETIREFEIVGGNQATLDTALINYTADQVNIDATFLQSEIDEETQRVKDTFDDDERRLLRAFAEVVKDEINILRGQHGLAARTLAQLRTAIINKIT